MKTYKITGNTYPVKDKIKKFGGKWDGSSWFITCSEFHRVLALPGVIATEITANTQKTKAADFDAMYNEGGEGFNPYR